MYYVVKLFLFQIAYLPENCIIDIGTNYNVMIQDMVHDIELECSTLFPSFVYNIYPVISFLIEYIL